MNICSPLSTLMCWSGKSVLAFWGLKMLMSCKITSILFDCLLHYGILNIGICLFNIIYKILKCFERSKSTLWMSLYSSIFFHLALHTDIQNICHHKFIHFHYFTIGEYFIDSNYQLNLWVKKKNPLLKILWNLHYIASWQYHFIACKNHIHLGMQPYICEKLFSAILCTLIQ